MEMAPAVEPAHFKQTMPLVSVVIPNYNGQEVIQNCLASVFDCGYENLQVIIVDDSSSDDSVKIVTKFSQVKIIRNDRNLGFARTVNTGIRAAEGTIIAILNMDTVVRKNWLAGLVEALNSDNRIGLVGSKILDPDGTTIQHAGGRISVNGISSHIGRGEPDCGQYDLLKDADYVCGASMAFRKDVITKVGLLYEGFSPLYYEDTDLAFRMKRYGYRVVCAPNSVIEHKENYSSGKLSSRFYFFYHKNRIKFMLRNFSLNYLFSKFMKNELAWLNNLVWGEEKKQAVKGYLINIGFFIGKIFLII